MAGMFIVFAVLGLSRLGVQDDIRLLQNPPKNLIDDQIKLSKLLDAPTPTQFYIVRGTTSEVVLQREEMLKERLDPLIEKRVISGYQAMSNWVPSSRAQAARRNLIDQTLLNANGPLAALAAQIGEDGKWVAAMRAHLLASSLPLTPGEFLKTPASEPWRHLWLGEVDGGHGSIVALRGLTYGSLPLLQHAGTGLDGVQWVDKVGEISSVLGRYRKYMGWVVLLSYFAVYGLLYPRYRSSDLARAGTHRVGQHGHTCAARHGRPESAAVSRVGVDAVARGRCRLRYFFTRASESARRHCLARGRFVGIEHFAFLRIAEFKQDTGAASVRPDDVNRNNHGVVDRSLF